MKLHLLERHTKFVVSQSLFKVYTYQRRLRLCMPNNS